MSRDISSDIVYDIAHSALHRGYIVNVIDAYTGEVYLRNHPLVDQGYYTAKAWVVSWIIRLMEAWPTCESTLNMELRSQRTIT